jgi:membrane protein implicated in regulation of membrane protease activity
MSLIAYYLAFMIVGDLAAYFIGLSVEYEWGPHVSLIVFLFLYFVFLWIAWLFAVQVTKPKTV